MTSTRLFTNLVLLAAMASIPAFAKPNFTGDWTLNVAKSDFGQIPAASAGTANMTHADPKLTNRVKLTTEQGEMETNFTYSTDGTETTNELMGNPMTTVAKWDGDVLTFDSKGKFGDVDFTLADKWSLSEDGKTITMDRNFKSAMGEGLQKLIWEKK